MFERESRRLYSNDIALESAPEYDLLVRGSQYVSITFYYD